MWYQFKQYDDISLAVVEYNTAEAEAATLLDISNYIDDTNITEWNWWNSKKKAI
jgi:hypothetical protein